MKLSRLIRISSFAFAIFGMVACQDNNRQNQDVNESMDMETDRENQVTQEGMTRSDLNEEDGVFETAQNDSDLSTFSENMNNPEMSQTINDINGSYTIFAPQNSAYEGMTQQERDEMNNQASASFHYLVVEEELTEEELRRDVENANGQHTLTTMQGEEIMVAMEGNDIILRDGSGNEATIVDSDTDGSNGIVYTIDAVLRPADGAQNAAGSMNQTTGGNSQSGNDTRTSKVVGNK